MNYYKCGHIMTTHGIKGALKVKNLSDFNRFTKGACLYVLHNDEYVLEHVLKVQELDAYLLVTFLDKEDINLVEKYRNDDIYISELDRKNNDLEDGEYYYSDLIGKEVINQDGNKKGKVTDIRDYPQGKYLVVSADKNVLVPFNESFIIDVKEKEIVINEIEGLF